MVSAQAILDICDQIVAEFSPETVILFGSHAYGAPDDNSDVDMLVVIAKGPDGYRKAARIADRIDPKFSFDLLVRTSAALAVINRRIFLFDCRARIQ